MIVVTPVDTAAVADVITSRTHGRGPERRRVGAPVKSPSLSRSNPPHRRSDEEIAGARSGIDLATERAFV